MRVCICAYMCVCARVGVCVGICVYVYMCVWCVSCILYLWSLFYLLVMGNPGGMNRFALIFAWGGSSLGWWSAFGLSASWGLSLGPWGGYTLFLLGSLGQVII